jgi:hypothetical protein
MPSTRPLVCAVVVLDDGLVVDKAVVAEAELAEDACRRSNVGI